MSDFFARLMDRSSGKTEVLRPRRSSVFEPVASEFPAVANHSLTRNSEAAPNQNEVAESTWQSRGNNEQETSHSALFAELPRRRAREVSIESHEDIEPSSAQFSLRVEREQAPSVLRAAHHPFATLHETDPRRASETSLQPEQSRLLEPEARRGPPLGPAREAFPNSNAPAEGVAVHLASRTNVGAVVSHDAPGKSSHFQALALAAPAATEQTLTNSDAAPSARLAAAKSFVLKPLSSQEHDGDRRFTDAKSPDVPPSIHVTIGRVEVRASVTGRPGPRQRAVSPVTSLEDYLKRQGNGMPR